MRRHFLNKAVSSYRKQVLREGEKYRRAQRSCVGGCSLKGKEVEFRSNEVLLLVAPFHRVLGRDPCTRPKSPGFCSSFSSECKPSARPGDGGGRSKAKRGSSLITTPQGVKGWVPAEASPLRAKESSASESLRGRPPGEGRREARRGEPPGEARLRLSPGSSGT